MAAESGPGIKRVKAKWLGLRGVDNLMNVNAHAHAELLQFVDHRDVDAAINVLEQLGHFGHGRAAYGHHPSEDGTVKGRCQFYSSRSASSHNLGNVVPGDSIVAGIFAFRRESHMEARFPNCARNLQPTRIAFLEQRHRSEE